MHHEEFRAVVHSDNAPLKCLFVHDHRIGSVVPVAKTNDVDIASDELTPPITSIFVSRCPLLHAKVSKTSRGWIGGQERNFAPKMPNKAKAARSLLAKSSVLRQYTANSSPDQPCNVRNDFSSLLIQCLMDSLVSLPQTFAQNQHGVLRISRRVAARIL